VVLGTNINSSRNSTGYTIDGAGSYDLSAWGTTDHVRYDTANTAVAGNRGLVQLGAGTGSNSDRINFYHWNGTASARSVYGIIETKTTTGDPTGHEGRIVINTVDNTVKIYADGGWRTIASGW
jgi:hypothetical protein